MSGQRTQWNEATRVQMPALVHLTRIGFTYFGKITEDKAGTVYDPDTNILIEVFKSQFAKLNPERAGEAEAMLRIIRQELDNDDIGESFYKRLKSVSPVRLIDFEHPENNASTIRTMLDKIGKQVLEITTDDLRAYLTDYQAEKKSSKVTIDNIRRILSSFFTWLEDEDYILKSPIRRIHKVKSAATIKETYSDESLEKMRDNCDSLRDLAMIDMLSSTGMRVGEMVRLNRDDIRFDERECVVFGKGDKERIVYFDARTKIHLQNYLQSRTDSEPALFVSLRSPHRRLTIGGIELRLRELGKRLDIPKVHPHKFRRTLATMAIDKGMPIEQLQHLLGHQRIDTTMHYAMVKQSNVKLAHKKYIG